MLTVGFILYTRFIIPSGLKTRYNAIRTLVIICTWDDGIPVESNDSDGSPSQRATMKDNSCCFTSSNANGIFHALMMSWHSAASSVRPSDEAYGSAFVLHHWQCRHWQRRMRNEMRNSESHIAHVIKFLPSPIWSFSQPTTSPSLL